MKAKRQAVQWIDGPDKTGSNGVGDEDLDVKPGEDESVGKRGAPQLDVLELELKQSWDLDKGTQEVSSDPEGVTRKAPPNPEERTQEVLPDPVEETRKASLDPGQETREVPLDRKKETREAPSYSDKETREAPSNSEKEAWEAPSDCEKEKTGVARLVAGSMDLGGLIVPMRRKLAIFRQIKSLCTWNRRVHAGIRGAAPQSFLPMDEEGDEKSVSMCDGEGAMILQRKMEISEPIAKGISPEQ